jgi:hypothetical protein
LTCTLALEIVIPPPSIIVGSATEPITFKLIPVHPGPTRSADSRNPACVQGVLYDSSLAPAGRTGEA